MTESRILTRKLYVAHEIDFHRSSLSLRFAFRERAEVVLPIQGASIFQLRRIGQSH